MNKIDFSWVDFYSEFATKLLEYKDDRNALIKKVTSIFENLGTKMPKLEEDNILRDIDPFTIFALFNKGITNDNRIAIIKEIAKLLNCSKSMIVGTGTKKLRRL